MVVWKWSNSLYNIHLAQFLSQHLINSDIFELNFCFIIFSRFKLLLQKSKLKIEDGIHRCGTIKVLEVLKTHETVLNLNLNKRTMYYLITVKHLYFAWPYFRESIALVIFTRLYFRDLSKLLLSSIHYNILSRTLFLRPHVLANLRENKVLANKKCFTVLKFTFIPHESEL